MVICQPGVGTVLKYGEKLGPWMGTWCHSFVRVFSAGAGLGEVGQMGFQLV